MIRAGQFPPANSIQETQKGIVPPTARFWCRLGSEHAGANADPESLASKAVDPQGPWQQQPTLLYHRFSTLHTANW